MAGDSTDRLGRGQDLEALIRILRGAPIVLFSIDREGRLVFAEGRGLEAFGFSVNEWVGRSVFEVYADLPDVIETFHKALAGEELTAVTPAGDALFETRYAPLRNPDGSLAGTIGVSVDVTARERALIAAREGDERRLEIARALASVSRGLLAGAAEEAGDELTRAMETVSRLAGAEHGALLTFGVARGSKNERFEWSVDGYPLPKTFALPWAAQRLFRGEAVVIEDARTLTDEAIAERADLLSRGVLAAIALPLRDGADLVGAVTLSCREPRIWPEADLAWLRIAADLFALALRHRWTEQALAARQSQLLQAQKMEAVGRLAGGIAHDFNNLLTVIAGNAASLAEQIAPASESGEDLREIQLAAERATALTRQLLSFGRPKALTHGVFGVNQVIHGLAGLMRRVLGEDVEVALRLDPDLWPVTGDAGQLEQVLVNLAVNARDAMPRGGTLRIATLRRTLRGLAAKRLGIAEGDYVMIAVTDTGTGMSEETRSRAFEPFFSTKAPESGTGLGLSIVYEMARHWGGGIEIESTPGTGTTVRIDLPRAVGTPTAATERSLSAAGGSESVLVVEDDAGVRRLIVRALESGGYRVLAAADGVEALERVAGSEASTDLLVSDVVMPKLGGLELARQLRARNPRLRVLLISGFPERVADDAAPSFADGFLQKPFAPSEILEKVREVLGDA
jgi:signal transduction histidine kinase/ActR/RegA family two-component response regulator